MKEIKLFKSRDGSWITNSNILSLLEEVDAPCAHVLFMHTGLTFGMPNPELNRNQLLKTLYQLIDSLGVPTLCVPTYTFSFCNVEDYNVRTSRSRMGVLNEYIRKLPEAVRSIDPLMSVALVGIDRDLVENLGKHSIGENSTFDKLHHCTNVKFLFFGASISECFTYTHYVEERLNVPYRYNREFTGNITDGEHTWEDTYSLFVRYRGVVPSSNDMLEKTLLRDGLLKKVDCGDSSIACIDEVDGYTVIEEHLKQNVYSYIASDPGDKNTEFFVRNMVAL